MPQPEFCPMGQDWFEIPLSYERGTVLKSLFQEED
jgi:hypothetical protein